LLDGCAGFGVFEDCGEAAFARMRLSTSLVDNPADIDVETMLHPLRRKRCNGFG